MWKDPLVFVATLAVLAVLAVLVIGIGSFGKGGEFNKRNANKLMRYRIYAQGFAVLVIVGVAWLRSRGGN